MKITLPLSKSDKNSFTKMYRLSHEDDKIPKKKKTNKIPEPLVTAPEVPQDPDDMEKGDKVGSSIEGSKKTSVCVTPNQSLKTPPPYNNKRDYKGDTLVKTLDSRTHDSDVLRKYDDSLKRNLDKEINNSEDDEYIDNLPLQKININSQSHENIRKRLLLKRFTRKIIDLVLSNIVIYEKNISAVDYINQAIETEDKCNQINVLSMESMLVANCIWIEETSQRINEFSIGYMFNPTLYTKKVFKEQVIACFKNTFGPDTN